MKAANSMETALSVRASEETDQQVHAVLLTKEGEIKKNIYITNCKVLSLKLM